MQLSLEEEAVCRLRMGQDTHVWAAEATSEWSNPPFLLPRALPGAAACRGAARLFDTCWSWGQMRNNTGRD